ncbi:MCE family protein [candidate division KSB1 bacterium]|nr:MCE family protein [candidate division KSB1 bacterium]
MVSRSQKIRLGIFVTLAIAVFVGTLVVIVAPRMFEDRETYKIGFRDVSLSGLQEGSAVKYQGLTVGYVSDISIDPDDIGRVLVTISLEEGTPIRKDTRAQIAYLGITGLKTIELKSGSPDAPSLEPGSFIESSRSITQEITGRAETLAEKTEIILNNLIELTSAERRIQFTKVAENTSETLEQLNMILEQNQDSFARTMDNVETFSYQLDGVTATTRDILDRVNHFTRSDTVQQMIGNFSTFSQSLTEADIVRLISELNITLEKTNVMLQDVEITFSKSRTDLVYTIETLKESVEYLNQFSRLISEDPSVLIRGAEPKNAPDFKLEQ